MPNFAYKVKTSQGSIISGNMEAPEQKMVVDKLRAQKYIVLEINAAAANPFQGLLDTLNIFKPKPKPKDLVLFSRQLSTLVSAGVPIVQGLSIIVEQIENPAFKTIVKSLREDIEGGIAINEAMGRHPIIFSDLYASMIKAGEVGGILDIILDRLSAYLEAAEELKGKVKGALMYPSIVALVAMGVTTFLLVFVIPTFKTIFGSFGAELPYPTQLLMDTSDFLRSNIIFILLGVAGIVVGVVQFYKSEKGKVIIDTQSLKVPVLGDLLRKVAVSKFTRTLGTLVKSGVPILQALDTVAKTAGNKVVEAAIFKARDSIKEGEKISDPLKVSGVFPPMVIQMISVGEETGSLDTMLTKIADFYDQEVDVAVEGLTSMIEPLIIVVMGVVIGGIVVAMFLPLMSMGDLASKG